MGVVGKDRIRAGRRDSGISKGCAWRRRTSAARAPAVRREQVVVASRRAPGDPFNTRGRPTMRAGLDLKDRLTTNLTLDATFNPDFGQVEVDPAVLNLSAFETFFPEKRPFFVEGVAGVRLRQLRAATSAATSKAMSGVLLAAHRARADRRRPRDRTIRVRRRARRDDDLGRRQDHRPHGERIHASGCSTR